MKRDLRMDIIKGLTIFLMVVGHSGFLYTSYIYLFHMAVFFMVSGYLFSFRKIESIKGFFQYTWRKVKGIWVPYFIWNFIYTVLNNAFLKIGIYSEQPIVVGEVSVAAHSIMSVKDMVKNIVKGIFMLGRTEMGGAFWFLRTLFAITILFGGVDYVLNKFVHKDKLADMFHLFISIVFLGCGYAANLLNIKSLAVPIVLSSYILYFMGYGIAKYEVMKRIKNWIAIVAGALVLLLCSTRVQISVGNNEYGNPFYLLVCSLAGWMLIYGLADIINQYHWKKIWVVLGVNSLAIVIHHFWCMKLVHLLQIAIYDYPFTYLAAFPYLKADGMWWIVYALVGAVVPVLISLLVKKGKEKIKNHA